MIEPASSTSADSAAPAAAVSGKKMPRPQGTGQRSFRGDRDRYTLLTTLTHQDSVRIFEETGYQIQWPPGLALYPVVTSLTESSEGKWCFGRGENGLFTVGFAEGQQKYVGVKLGMPDGEIAIQRALKGLSHVMQLRDTGDIVDETGRTERVQVMDFAGLGSLSEIGTLVHGLKDEAFREQVIHHLARGLFEGVAGLHDRGVVHLDVKPGNFVVDHFGDVWAIDFGCARQSIDVDGPTTIGDRHFYSPERFMADGVDPSKDRCDGPAIDGWALGLTMVQLVANRRGIDLARIEHLQTVPLASLTPTEALEQLIGEQLSAIPEFKNPLPGSVWEIVRGLLEIKPTERLSVREALAHPWFARMGRESAPYRERIRALLREFVQSSGANKTTKAMTPQDIPLPHFANYVSRPQLEDLLAERLLRGDALTACSGPPGMGKTKLVNRVLQHPSVQKRFGMRLWVRHADDREQVQAQLLALALELNVVDRPARFEDAYPKLEAYLKGYEGREGKPWLMVFDNADDPQMLRSLMPKGGQIIVTSRSNDWPEPLSITKLDVDEGNALVHLLLQKSDGQAAELCEELACVPLGIAQACAYIRNQKLTIGAYLELLRQSSIALSVDEQLYGNELPYSMSAMYLLTFKALEGVGAMPLLHALSFLSPADISDTVCNAVDETGGRAVQALVDYGILERQSVDSVGLHQLTRRMAWHSDPEPSISGLVTAMTGVAGCYTFHAADQRVHSNERLYPHGMALLQFVEGGVAIPPRLRQGIASAVHTVLREPIAMTLEWVVCESVERGDVHLDSATLPRIGQLEELARELQGLDINRDPQRLDTLARVLKAAGQPTRVLPLRERCLALVSDRQGGSRDQVVVAYLELGKAYVDLGRIAEALPLYRRGLEAAEQLYGNDHSQTARVRGHLGVAYCKLRENDDSDRVLSQAVACFEKAGLVVDPDLALFYDVIGQLASSAEDGDRYKWAHDLAVKAGDAPCADSHYPKNFERTVNLLTDDPTSDYGSEAFITSIRLRTLSIEITRKVGFFGKSHPEVARDLCRAVDICMSLEMHDEAIEYGQRALKIQMEAFAGRGVEVADTMCKLASSYDALGNYRQAAIKYFDQALPIAVEAYGEDHVFPARILESAAEVLRLSGDGKEGCRVLERALSMKKRIYGEFHLEVASSMCRLGQVLTSIGERDRAIETLHRAHEILQRTTYSHEVAGTILTGLGHLAMDTPDKLCAVEWYAKARDSIERCYGGQSDEAAESINQLAEAWLAAGHERKGMELHAEAVALYRALDDNHPKVSEPFPPARRNARCVII